MAKNYYFKDCQEITRIGNYCGRGMSGIIRNWIGNVWFPLSLVSWSKNVYLWFSLCVSLISSVYYTIVCTQLLLETFETDFPSLFTQFPTNETASREKTHWKIKKETIHVTGVHSKWSWRSSGFFLKLWAPSSQLLARSFSWNPQVPPLDVFWGWMQAIA